MWCGRRCRLRCRLGWCNRRAFMTRKGLSWCRCTWACAVLGGCRLGVAGCCVLCFLFWACVPLLTVCMLCSSCLCSGFFSAPPDAYSALCLVLHCTAPLDVSHSLIRMAQPQHSWVLVDVSTSPSPKPFSRLILKHAMQQPCRNTCSSQG